MSMNIKNEAAHKLARQLSRITGESITEAVTESLRKTGNPRLWPRDCWRSDATAPRA